MPNRVDDGRIVFSAPEGLRDDSRHRYSAVTERGNETLVVTYGFLPREASPAQVIDGQRDDLRAFCHDVSSGTMIDRVREIRVAGHFGAALIAELTDVTGRGARHAIVSLVARIADQECLRLRWESTGTSDARETMPVIDLDALLDALVRSIAEIDRPTIATIPPGWVRRCAGAFSLGVPRHLVGPSEYRFVDDRTGMQVVVCHAKGNVSGRQEHWKSYFDGVTGLTLEPSSWRPVLHRLSAEQGLERETQVTVDRPAVQLRDMVLVEEIHARHAVLEASVPATSDHVVGLFAAAPERRRETLHATWSNVMASLWHAEGADR